MVRRVILMRHARAGSAASDHERPLESSGRQDAWRIGTLLAERGWWPEHVLCSDAKRASETWAWVVEGLGRPAAVEFDRLLYDRGAERALDLLSRLPNATATVALVGHNPAWEGLASWFSGEVVALGTANTALLEATASTWAAAVSQPAGFRLVETLRPDQP